MTSDVALPIEGSQGPHSKTTEVCLWPEASSILPSRVCTDGESTDYLNTPAGYDAVPNGASMENVLQGDKSPGGSSIVLNSRDLANHNEYSSQELQRDQASSASQGSQCIACFVKTNNDNKKLTCVPCKVVSIYPQDYRHQRDFGSQKVGCPIVDCSKLRCILSSFSEQSHIKSHCGENGHFHVIVKHCPLANKTFKRWPDLIRHNETAHCKNAKTYHCLVLGCKYHDRHSFSRRDKLASHIRNVHAGHVVPGGKLCKLKPAAKKGQTSKTAG